MSFYPFLEKEKIPGNKFCDQVGWKIKSKYNELQRPDKITILGGDIYRTHTPITYIWYQNKNIPNHHVWIEFTGNSIIVKNRIAVSYTNGISFGSQLLTPNSDKYASITYFNSNERAANYIMSLI